MGTRGAGRKSTDTGISDDAVEAVRRRIGDRLWVVTAARRANRVHGRERCGQRRPPSGALADDVGQATCADCVQLWWQMLAEIARREVARPGFGDQLTEARLDSLFTDAWRTWTSVYRWPDDAPVQRPERTLRQAAWARRAVPDDLDRELALQALWYVQGHDRHGTGVLPTERFAERVRPGDRQAPDGSAARHDPATGAPLSADESHRRTWDALHRLSDASPEWMEINFWRRLSERQAGHVLPPRSEDPESEDALASLEAGASLVVPAGLPGVGADVAAQHDLVVDAATRRVAAGEYADEALRAELERRVGPRSARGLLGGRWWRVLLGEVLTACREEGLDPGIDGPTDRPRRGL